MEMGWVILFDFHTLSHDLKQSLNFLKYSFLTIAILVKRMIIPHIPK